MKEQLELVGESYDKAIDLGRKGIDLYKELPEYITKDPDYRCIIKGEYQINKGIITWLNGVSS